MKTSLLILTALLAPWAAGAAAESANPLPAKPNIVFIVSDDMGYADLPKFGKSEVPTPNMDRLADSGALFSNAYVSGPICVPSRMAMVTGRHQARWGVCTNVYGGPAFDEWNKEKTLAEFLKSAGYSTALIGKWHLSGNGNIVGIAPDERGYDLVEIIPGGMSSYRAGVRVYQGNGKYGKAPEYLTDHFGKRAAAFIADHKGKQPFFLHLAFNAVHAPLEALATDKVAFEDEEAHADRKTYAGMLVAMDRNIGRVLDALKDYGLEENTLVAFVNDNGGPALDAAGHSRNMANNTPLRGHKFDCLEGGVRVPMLLRWPGRIKPGVKFDGMVSAMDFAPTFLTAAGVPLPTVKPMDGVDLMPWIVGKKTGNPHDTLCWRSYFGNPKQGQTACRHRQWKIHQICPITELPKLDDWALYDLSQDIGESQNLAAQHPERVKELHEMFVAWVKQTPAPQVVQRSKDKQGEH